MIKVERGKVEWLLRQEVDFDDAGTDGLGFAADLDGVWARGGRKRNGKFERRK